MVIITLNTYFKAVQCHRNRSSANCDLNDRPTPPLSVFRGEDPSTNRYGESVSPEKV